MSQVIEFCGTKHRGKVYFLVFSVQKSEEELASEDLTASVKSTVEVPVDQRTAEHVMLHLKRLVPTPVELVERGNDEESV